MLTPMPVKGEVMGALTPLTSPLAGEVMGALPPLTSPLAGEVAPKGRG